MSLRDGFWIVLSIKLLVHLAQPGELPFED
jgi:hypothetical protein